MGQPQRYDGCEGSGAGGDLEQQAGAEIPAWMSLKEAEERQ